MSTVDFTSWATGDLNLTLGDRTYPVRPPSVEGMATVLAAAALAEIQLGAAEGPLPADLQELLDAIPPGTSPSLGDQYGRLIEDGIDRVTLDRMAFYATFYWARGKETAQAMAVLFWSAQDADTEVPEDGAEPAPKG